MPRAAKSWSRKMNARPPHVVKLEADFAGVPKGSRLLISSPRELADFIRSIPPGRSLPIQQLRRELAARHGADAACPVSTSIFLRIVTEDAFEQVQAGVAQTEWVPVWRVIEPDSPLLRKVSFDPAWILRQRELEGLTTTVPPRRR